jgi:hypothetical protein
MAKGFAETNGVAKKGGKFYKWVDGEQIIRLVGEIVPRYVYWKSTIDDEGKTRNVSIECLGFDRDAEKFTNIEKDWFKHYWSDQQCSWSYVCRAIDPADATQTILIPMKKKLYQQIQEVAKELGDPTNPETGWDCIVKREKTGAQAYNVEYTLKQLQCKVRTLSEEELEAIEKMDPMDDLVPRLTSNEQHQLIKDTWFKDNNTTNSEEAVSQFDNTSNKEDDEDDISF